MIDLTQADADALLNLAKRSTEGRSYRLPPHGGRLAIPLEDLSGREAFMLDFSRGRIRLERRTYQTRARQTLILARLDFGPPHRNPDGEEIGAPHLHLYREGYGDKWAQLLPRDHFPHSHDPWRTLLDFMAFCNIVEPPQIERDLLE